MRGCTLIVMNHSKTICLHCAESRRLFMEACERMQAIGGQLVQIRFEPFAETARLLYTSAFMAERYAGIRTFLEGKVSGLLLLCTIRDAGSCLPVAIPNVKLGLQSIDRFENCVQPLTS